CPSRRRRPRLRRPSLHLRPPSPPRRRESPPSRRLPRRRSRLPGTLPRSIYRSRQAVATRTPALHRPRAWRRFPPTESRTRRFPAAAIRCVRRTRAARGAWDPGNDDPACLRRRRWPRRGGADSRVRRPSRPRQRGGRGCQAMALRAGQTRSRSGRCVGATPRGIPASIGAHMRIVVSMLILLLAAPAMAQQPTAPPSQQAPPRLEPVVVEGVRVPADRTRTDQEASEELSRVPGGTAVIDQTTIEQTRGANLKDVLDFVPGVMIRPRFGAADESQLSIRGSGLRNNFHLRGINVLIDGFIYGQADGFSDFESLELLTTN